MDLPNHESGLPIPISTTFGGGNHPHIIHGPPPPPPPLPPPTLLDIDPYNTTTNNNNKVSVKYRECLKNHAAAMGGNATDGCGEFMPSGEEGTMDALICSACTCHRNFHRKDFEGSSSADPPYLLLPSPLKSRKVVGQKGVLIASDPLRYSHHQHHHHPQQMVMSYNMVGSESDEQDFHQRRFGLVKKRFRTKFTPEQKEKMMSFAAKVGWKIQRQEESVVQQFCQEVGVKRKVLKVWMHNNKHNFAKKEDNNIDNNDNNNNSSMNE
uniref:Zinc finger-homeodomain protein 1 n=1 Tax=Acorus calamus var. americanus TaxID=263995 RepID=B0LK16_ACOCI|nr:zinc finger-homeodomain protein 1 [Acorus calamus var. americanus]